jgi:hypothetical protein
MAVMNLCVSSEIVFYQVNNYSSVQEDHEVIILQ